VARVLFSVFGAVILLLGGLFLPFSFGSIGWEKTNTLWPLFIIIAGAAALFAYFIENRKTKPLFFTSIGLIIGGFIVLAFLAG
jgi:hypothetical protein